MNPRQQSYAPTPHSYVPNTNMSATINLDEEVKLSETRAEQDIHESLAELFSIIVTIDQLEKAFLKDAIPEAEYTEICERSLRQYKALLADETISKAFGTLEEFKARWNLEVPRATERLRVGMPSTTLTASSSSGPTPSSSGLGGMGGGGPGGSGGAPGSAAAAAKGTSGVLILEATQEFITFLDAVKLGLLSKDQLHPLLSDVIQSVNKVTDKDFENRGKIVQWLITLNQMKATEELGEQQARELELDIQQAYQGFRSTLT
ncbi:ESCRT-I complex subunit VPS28 [Geosmithia morbida]|uniref:Vacuolar protein sorting-associated protein 28 n=1 Tax=Geosmithia morbida TaxID=1094350 RepID=A0A9P4Z1L2_9HYPO|nr:ESCRT-I complex subunit VPS28 [Geosmithia morbida]KAF4124964.1 ESCRT-I complex subunit VPS28 [Geosmithia morbida]